MEIPFVLVFEILLSFTVLITPISGWRRGRFENERNAHFKSGFSSDNSIDSSDFNRDPGGLVEGDKEGGRGFFYFEKNGKKLVGYMDYGDDQKGGGGQTEKDNVMTYTIPSTDHDNNNDNIFAMAKPTDEQKVYYFSSNQEISPKAGRTIIHTYKPKTYYHEHHHIHPVTSAPQTLRRQSGASNGHQGEMFDHGYSKNDNGHDMDKRREDFHKEYNQVEVSRSKWEPVQKHRPMDSKPRMIRVNVKPERQEPRQPWRERRRMPPRHEMVELKPHRSFNSPKRHMTVRTRRPSRDHNMGGMSHNTGLMPSKNVELLYESDDRKMNNADDDYEGRVYIMMPKSQGSSSNGIREWINSDFFTDTFIESFHPSSIDTKHSRQARMPVAKVIKVVPYYPQRTEVYKV